LRTPVADSDGVDMVQNGELTAAEVTVLCDVEPDAMLWEIAATWTDNGSDTDRIEAVPTLHQAVGSLIERGLVELYDFPSWPTRWEQAIAVPPEKVSSVLADAQVWLWREDDLSLLTVAITDRGVAWLSSQAWH
jgi:hypothetical protein